MNVAAQTYKNSHSIEAEEDSTFVVAGRLRKLFKLTIGTK